MPCSFVQRLGGRGGGYVYCTAVINARAEVPIAYEVRRQRIAADVLPCLSCIHDYRACPETTLKANCCGRALSPAPTLRSYFQRLPCSLVHNTDKAEREQRFSISVLDPAALCLKSLHSAQVRVTRWHDKMPAFCARGTGGAPERQAAS